MRLEHRWSVSCHTGNVKSHVASDLRLIEVSPCRREHGSDCCHQQRGRTMAEAAPIPAADAGQPLLPMDGQAPAFIEGEGLPAHPLLSAGTGPSTSSTAPASAAPPTAAPSRKEKRWAADVEQIHRSTNEPANCPCASSCPRAAGAAAKTKPAVASLPSRAGE